MARAQCIVHRKNTLLMVKHRQDGEEWWCLPGGGIEAEETAAAAALRELKEECGVDGIIIRETSHLTYALTDHNTYTFLIDIGSQIPRQGSDPEFAEDEQILVDVQWLALSQIPARDRAFVWAAGLLGVAEFFAEVAGWGDSISYPHPG